MSLLLASLAATLGTGCAEPSTAYLFTEAYPGDVVVEAPGHTGEGFFDSALAVNGVRGAGAEEGSLDVYSLGLDAEANATLVLRWSGARVHNGPGADFVVFENAFDYLPGLRFMDPVIVEVSEDGERFVPLPHDYLAADEGRYSPSPADWVGFAGITPVFLHEEERPLDPFDTARAGGDAFDLDALPEDGGLAQSIREGGFIFLRLTTAAAAINPDTGALFPRDPASDGADIDGVYARYLEAER